MTIRPRLSTSSGANAVDVEQPFGGLDVRLGQRTGQQDAGIVDERVESPPGGTHGFDRGIDIGLHGHVDADRFDVLDRIERIQVRLLACAGVDEVTRGGCPFGQRPAETRRCPGDQDGFQVGRRLGRRFVAARHGGQEHGDDQRRDQSTYHCNSLRSGVCR